MTYQYHWVASLQQIQNTMGPGELTEANREWLKKLQPDVTAFLRGAEKLGFTFQLGQELKPNKDGRQPSTLEWAKRISADDIQILAGTRPFTDKVPDPDDGFTQADLRDPQRAVAIHKIINARLVRYQKEAPRGYLVRDAKKEDLKTLPLLKGHVQPDQYITKFRHVFTRAEMNEDLVLTQAKVGDVADVSEHDEVLRQMMFGGRGRFSPPIGNLPVAPPVPR